MKKKHLLLLSSMIILMFVLSGCSEINKPITSESAGFWNQYIVYPLSWLITNVAEFMGGSYGLSLVIVTILLRTAILPLMIKQTKSSKAMQAIQPEMKRLQAKYSSKDAATQQKLQKEMMELYQKNNINPMAGCLPIFIQMPILIGFYHAIQRTAEIKLHTFLWFDLGAPDPYYILPILAAVFTFVQQKMTMKGMDKAGPQAAQMNMMLYLMPIMILVFALKFPAALSLYWVVGNLFSIGQTYFIKGPTVTPVGEQTNTKQTNTKQDKVPGTTGGKKK